MALLNIGARIRDARTQHALTQAELARRAGLSRVTINRLENGLLADLGFEKVLAVANVLGLTLVATPLEKGRGDILAMAARSGSVGFSSPLSTRELLDALLKGEAPKGKAPHLVRLFEDQPIGYVRRLLRDVSRLAPPGRVAASFGRLASDLGLSSELARQCLMFE